MIPSVRAANEMGGLSQPSASVQLGGASTLTDVKHDMTTDQPKYNLKGQRVATPRKGINIVGGKKVIIK